MIASGPPRDSPAMELELTIITPERKHQVPRLRQVVFPSPTGEIGILPGHAALLSIVDTGLVRAFAAGRDANAPPLSFIVANGSIRAIDNHLTLLTQRADREDELELDAIHAELGHAEHRVATLDPLYDADAREEAIHATNYCAAAIALEQEISTRHPDLTSTA